MASSGPTTGVQSVQIDGLVVLKIIKHCQEEGAGGTDLVQGVILGLFVDTRLEITNCFPIPKYNDDEEFEASTARYQVDMMRNLRHVTVDHLHVGYYQSTYFGSFINRAMLDSQFSYQSSIEESVVLIYDPLKTTQGFLSLKAYRLTPRMMKFYEEGDFSPENVRKTKLSFEKMFEEIPVHIRNSHLTNLLLCEIEENTTTPQSDQFLDLATSSVLEKNVRQLMECVDDITQDCNKYFNYQRQHLKQQAAKQQYTQRRQQENQARVARGEAPLPEEDITKIFKPLQVPPRLDSLLIAGQIDNYCQQISEYSSQSLGKLFMSESLQTGEGPSKS